MCQGDCHMKGLGAWCWLDGRGAKLGWNAVLCSWVITILQGMHNIRVMKILVKFGHVSFRHVLLVI
jgi:hypothetical protein